MSYITMITGDVLQSEWDAKQVLANIVQCEREGKSWLSLRDGCYYRISHVVSVSDRCETDIGGLLDSVFGRGAGDAE